MEVLGGCNEPVSFPMRGSRRGEQRGSHPGLAVPGTLAPCSRSVPVEILALVFSSCMLSKRTFSWVLYRYRLACVGILFQDLEFAQQNQVEKALWTSHILINNIYRNVSKRLPSDQKVKIRSVESRYTRFITTSQLFYKGYIQRLSMRYNVEPLHRIAAAVKAQCGPGQDSISSITPETQAMIMLSVQETLTYLGDLSRYRAQLKPNSRDNEAAITYYSLAHDVVPDRGFALHQIGVTYLETDKHLEVVYYFFMSLARQTPHPNAEKNLEAKLKTIQAGKSAISGSQSTQQILEGRVVQLLAKYMTNTSFPGRDELEQTVLARLEQFLHSEHSSDSVVRMAMVNMSAYYYAQKHQGECDVLFNS